MFMCVCVCWLDHIFEGYTQNFPQWLYIAFILRNKTFKEMKPIPSAMKYRDNGVTFLVIFYIYIYVY